MLQRRQAFLLIIPGARVFRSLILTTTGCWTYMCREWANTKYSIAVISSWFARVLIRMEFRSMLTRHKSMALIFRGLAHRLHSLILIWMAILMPFFSIIPFMKLEISGREKNSWAHT